MFPYRAHWLTAWVFREPETWPEALGKALKALVFLPLYVVARIGDRYF